MIKFLVMDVDGTLTDGKIYMGESGELFKVFNIKDGCGIKDILPTINIEPIIITARNSKILENRCKELNIKKLYQGIRNKIKKLDEIINEYNELNNTSIAYANIAYIGDDYSRYEPFDLVHDCLGNVLLPGFKNAHTHNAMTFLSSKTDELSLHDWLFNAVFPREALLKEEDVYHLSKVAFLEMLSSGITACFDQYSFPLSTAKAAEEIGFKITLLGVYNSIFSKEDLRRLFLIPI